MSRGRLPCSELQTFYLVIRLAAVVGLVPLLSPVHRDTSALQVHYDAWSQGHPRVFEGLRFCWVRDTNPAVDPASSVFREYSASATFQRCPGEK